MGKTGAKAKKAFAKIADESKQESDVRVKLLRKSNAELERKLSEKEAGLDILRTAFEQAYDEPLDIPIATPPKQSKVLTGVEIPVLHITDVHFGKKTETYNSFVAAERMARLAEKTIDIINIRRTHARIDEMRVYFGGDFGEGEGAIFPGQQHEIDQDIVDQCAKFGPEKMAGVLLTLLGCVKKIKVCGVPGNHGRNGDRNAPKRHNYDSWFYYVTRLMTDLTLHQKQNQSRIGDIEWDLPFDRHPGNAWYCYDKTFGWGHMIVHGNQFQGQLGYPWYGVGRKAGKWPAVIKRDVHYFWHGHFHTEGSFEVGEAKVLAGASPESGNSHAAENHGGGGSPKQRLASFNEKYGLIADMPIYLDS